MNFVRNVILCSLFTISSISIQGSVFTEIDHSKIATILFAFNGTKKVEQALNQNPTPDSIRVQTLLIDMEHTQANRQSVEYREGAIARAQAKFGSAADPVDAASSVVGTRRREVVKSRATIATMSNSAAL